MNPNLADLVVRLAAALVMLVGGYAVWSSWSDVEPTQEPSGLVLEDEPSEEVPRVVAPPEVTRDQESAAPIPIAFEEGVESEVVLKTVRALDGSPVAASGSLGAPGVYPGFDWITERDGRTPVMLEVASDLGGDDVQMLEVLARAEVVGETLAQWDVVVPGESGEYTVALESAQPLVVEVVEPSGAPAVGASVRLSLGVVGLVAKTRRTGAGGVVTFDALPEGTYSLVVEQPGSLRQRAVIEHELTDEEDEPLVHVVALERTRAIFGEVRDSFGRPVADALVEVYVDPVMREDRLVETVVSEVYSERPSAVSFSDVDGFFALDGLPAGLVYVVARGRDGAVGVSNGIDMEDLLDAGPIEVVLAGGVDVIASVVQPDGSPASPAWVEWRDDVTGAGRREPADAKGIAILAQVPATALIRAYTDGWSSGWVSVPPVDEDGVGEVTLGLERDAERVDWWFRVVAPRDVEIVSLDLFRPGRDEQVRRCLMTPARADTYRVSGCAPGSLWLEVTTARHGTHRAEYELADAKEIVLGAPADVRLVVKGRPKQLLESMVSTWTHEDEAARPIAHLARTRRGDERIWEHRLYEGVYTLSASIGEETWTRTLSVGEEGASVTWSLPVELESEIFVIDRYGRPVRGAHVEAWRGDRLVGEFVSEGSKPVRVRFEGQGREPVEWIASHWALGEGRLWSDAGERVESGRLEIGAPLMSVDGPRRLVDRAEIEAVLGAALVKDSDAWLIDARRGSAAARAGIPRAARFVRARRTKKGVSVLFEVSGEAAARIATLPVSGAGR